MIMVSGPAARRLARAAAEHDAARLAYIHADVGEDQAACARLDDAKVEKDAASDAVAAELIEAGYHEMEGDD